MKDKFCLVDSENHLRGGGVTTNWAMMNFNEVLLMLNTAVLTCLQTLSVMTTFDDSLSRTFISGSNPNSDPGTNSGHDNEKEQHCDLAQREKIDYKDIGL